MNNHKDDRRTTGGNTTEMGREGEGKGIFHDHVICIYCVSFLLLFILFVRLQHTI